ncbi:Hypothetical predicted protein [Mytilus galloprovincialis]|uniref:Macro domain-containing protein n=1 Tax=Mytilus galloprovincialis TaxID=29158 RepID=A0A8B6DI44_MYTGA|nr:Hypothetical predicted protein [Mytilus galloprovincialis]
MSVNTTNAELKLDKIGLSSQAILSAAGNSIQSECDVKYPFNINPGDVAITGPGYLEALNIFHIYLLHYNDSEDEKKVVAAARRRARLKGNEARGLMERMKYDTREHNY